MVLEISSVSIKEGMETLNPFTLMLVLIREEIPF